MGARNVEVPESSSSGSARQTFRASGARHAWRDPSDWRHLLSHPLDGLDAGRAQLARGCADRSGLPGERARVPATTPMDDPDGRRRVVSYRAALTHAVAKASASFYFGRYATRATSEIGTGATIARISV